MRNSLNRQKKQLAQADIQFSDSKRLIEEIVLVTTNTVKDLGLLHPAEISGYLTSKAEVLKAVEHLYRVVEFARNAREQAIDAEQYGQAVKDIVRGFNERGQPSPTTSAQ